MRTITISDKQLEHIKNALLAQRYAWRGLRRESTKLEANRIDNKINDSLRLSVELEDTAQRMKEEDPAVKALLVILLTWKTRQFLFNEDPMAFRQAEDAVLAAGSDVREHYEAGVKRLYENNH